MKRDETSIRTIWGLAKSPELHMTDEELHMVVQAQTGKESIRSLTKTEIRRIVYVLAQMKESARGGRRAKMPSASGPTENQKRKLYKLMVSTPGWNEKRIGGLCRRLFRVDSPEWLDYQQMSKLIEAVKAIQKRKESGDEAEADGKAGEEAACDVQG